MRKYWIVASYIATVSVSAVSRDTSNVDRRNRRANSQP